MRKFVCLVALTTVCCFGSVVSAEDLTDKTPFQVPSKVTGSWQSPIGGGLSYSAEFDGVRMEELLLEIRDNTKENGREIGELKTTTNQAVEKIGVLDARVQCVEDEQGELGKRLDDIESQLASLPSASSPSDMPPADPMTAVTPTDIENDSVDEIVPEHGGEYDANQNLSSYSSSEPIPTAPKAKMTEGGVRLQYIVSQYAAYQKLPMSLGQTVHFTDPETGEVIDKRVGQMFFKDGDETKRYCLCRGGGLWVQVPKNNKWVSKAVTVVIFDTKFRP